MISKSKIQQIFALVVLVYAGLASAVPSAPTTPAPMPEDPIKMLREVTTNVLQALKTNHAQPDHKVKKIYDVVDRFILPHVDFNEMSTWVAGRTAWGKATDKTKAEFIEAFKILVVRTYATAIDSYSNEVVEFNQQKVDTSKTRIQIKSVIKRGNKDNIHLEYRLIKHEDAWMVYDVIIEGVSILQGFQAQFSEEIKHKGLDTVISQIKEHNKKGDTA